jgi:hypothetical protein
MSAMGELPKCETRSYIRRRVRLRFYLDFVEHEGRSWVLAVTKSLVYVRTSFTVVCMCISTDMLYIYVYTVYRYSRAFTERKVCTYYVRTRVYRHAMFSPMISQKAGKVSTVSTMSIVDGELNSDGTLAASLTRAGLRITARNSWSTIQLLLSSPGEWWLLQQPGEEPSHHTMMKARNDTQFDGFVTRPLFTDPTCECR